MILWHVHHDRMKTALRQVACRPLRRERLQEGRQSPRGQACPDTLLVRTDQLHPPASSSLEDSG